jgi:hypothetical protein
VQVKEIKAAAFVHGHLSDIFYKSPTGLQNQSELKDDWYPAIALQKLEPFCENGSSFIAFILLNL